VRQDAVICKHCHSELKASSAPVPIQAKSHSQDSRELENAIFAGNFSQVVALLPAPQLAAYQAEIDRRRKHIGVAYLYHFLLGIYGAAKFYLREPNWGALYLACTLLMIGLTVLAFVLGMELSLLKMPDLGAGQFVACYVVALCCSSIVSTGFFFDLFLIPRQVNKSNDRIRQDILIDIARRMYPNDQISNLPEVPAPSKAIAFALAGMFVVTGTLTVIGMTVSHFKTSEPVAPTQATTYETPSPSPSPSPSPNDEQTNQVQEPQQEAPTETRPLSSTSDTPNETVQHDLDSVQPEQRQPIDQVEAQRLNVLGLAQLKLKDFVQASDYFSKAHQADFKDAKYLSNLGYSETKSGELDAAKGHLLSSLTLDATRAVAWDDIGEVYAKQGSKDAAVYCLRKGYTVSNGDTLPYLQSLEKDDDHKVVEASQLAISKLGLLASNADQPAPGKYALDAYTLVLKRHGNQSDFQIDGQHGDNSGSAGGSGVFVNGVLTYREDATNPDSEVLIKTVGQNKLDVKVGPYYCGMGVNLDGTYTKAN
jgi:tetratricopeptide (TPR) repeat protein